MILLVGPAPAGAAKAKVAKVKQAPHPVWTLAMDGPRAAYMSGGRVYVWNVITGATSVEKGTYAGSSKNGEVAIAGQRVAWITRTVAGTAQETTERLYTAPMGGWTHQLGSAYLHRADATLGGTITGLAGSGQILAVSTWKTKDSLATDQQLSLVTPGGLQAIVTGPNAIVSESVAGGHIAVLPPSVPATVSIYSAAGTLLRTIEPGQARELAISGNRLVVLTAAKTLKVYDWSTGALTHIWPVAAESPARQKGGANLEVYGRLAVVTGTSKLHLLDLTSGKDVVIARASDARYTARDATIGPSGLVYVVNYPNTGGQPRHGKLVFVPTAKLLARLRSHQAHYSVHLPESVAIHKLPPPALAQPSHSYGWPIRPFDKKHRIRSGFGDPRFGDVERNFHFGIDIPAPDGTPVYAVAPGIAHLSPGHVAVLTNAERGHAVGFTYWHINSAVPEGSFVGLHSLIGWIKPGMGHVHFAEIEHDRYVNPLRPGALTPAPDLNAPAIGSITVASLGKDGDVDGAVRGRIQIFVNASTRPTQTPPAPWQESVISPSLIRWRLLSHGTPVSEWRTAVDFRNYIPANTRYADIYTAEAKADHPNKSGIFLYYLARNWKTSSLSPGAYTIKVVAYSTGRKKTTATAPLQIAQPQGGQS
jgi:murein DD-endopeptidase MepM/ murein hydrolase activator NlpD